MPLSRVDVAFLFWNYLRYSPVYKPLLIYFILETISLVVISSAPAVDKPFLLYFLSVFIGCFWGCSFQYSSVFKPFLVNFQFLVILIG